MSGTTHHKRPKHVQKKEAPLTLTKVKKQLRNQSRQFEHIKDKLPANVLLEKERTIRALQTTLKSLQCEQKVKEIAKKYKLVRFFDRKKAVRQYKSTLKQYKELEKQFKECGEEDKEIKKQMKKLRKQLSHCEIDVAYVGNFPHDKKYISLYPKEQDPASIDENVKRGLLKTQEQRNQYRKEFEQKIKDGSLVLSVDDVVRGKNDYSIVSEDFNNDDEANDAQDAQAADEDGDDFFE